MTIALVLDHTAALAYSKNSIHVGEPIAMLFDESGLTFAVPATAVAEAAVTTDDLDTLILLGRHPLAEITGYSGGDWVDMARMSQALGGQAYAIPLITAREHDAYLMTAQPERYPDSHRVIDIGQ